MPVFWTVRNAGARALKQKAGRSERHAEADQSAAGIYRRPYHGAENRAAAQNGEAAHNSRRSTQGCGQTSKDAAHSQAVTSGRAQEVPVGAMAVLPSDPAARKIWLRTLFTGLTRTLLGAVAIFVWASIP